MKEQFLEIKDLKKSFGTGEARQDVLRGMNFTVKKGEFCVLLGPFGSGKSTLLNIIGGIDTPDEGFVSIGGDKLEEMSEKELTLYRRKHLGYVFQSYNLISNLTVRENIQVCEYLAEDPLNMDELLETLGLTEHVNRPEFSTAVGLLIRGSHHAEYTASQNDGREKFQMGRLLRSMWQKLKDIY